MSEENVFRKYAQFDGTNWINWKFRINILLDEKNLKEYIEKTLEEICEATIDDVDKEKCIKEEKKCKSILVQCIADSHLEYVQDKKTAKDMFDALKAVFERKSVAGQLFLRKKLLTLKYDETDNITNHFLVFDKTVRELKGIGAKLEDMDVICQMLLTLPKSYSTLVTALETLDIEKLTIDFVKSRIMDECNKMKNSSNSSCEKSSDSVAMFGGKSKANIKCYRCNLLGHIATECRAIIEKTANLASEHCDSIVFSSFVRSDGKCKNKSKSSEKKSYNNRFVMDGVKNSAQRRIIKMYLDSGATNHIVNDEKVFIELKQMKQENILIAKKGVTLTADRKGDVAGLLVFKNQEMKCTLKDVRFTNDLNYNILSIGKMEKAGMVITFKNGSAFISYKRKLLYVAKRRNDLYELDLVIEQKPIPTVRSKKKKLGLKKGNNYLVVKKKAETKLLNVSVMSSEHNSYVCGTQDSINKSKFPTGQNIVFSGNGPGLYRLYGQRGKDNSYRI